MADTDKRAVAALPILNNMEADCMRAVLYERSSTAAPFAKDALRGRQAMMTDYAEKAGIEIVETCVDVGYLGSTMERPGLQAALRSIREGKADVLLLYDRDRLNKGVLLEELRNVPVVVVDEEQRHNDREDAAHER